jgi:hypothetical protein
VKREAEEEVVAMTQLILKGTPIGPARQNTAVDAGLADS